MLTQKDTDDAKKFDDIVCYTTTRGLDKAWGLPYRIFLPRKIDNVIIGSGKCVSIVRAAQLS